MLILIIASIVVKEKKSSISPIVEPTITPFVPNYTPPPNIPTGFLQQHRSDLQYAEERKKVLKEKPWLLKLPLQSNEYFVIYDTEKNEFIITIYYAKSASSGEKEQQITNAKKNVLQAMREIDINLNREKVVFDERGI